MYGLLEYKGLMDAAITPYSNVFISHGLRRDFRSSMSTVVDKPRHCEITARYFVVFHSTKSMFCSYSYFLSIFQNYTIIVN